MGVLRLLYREHAQGSVIGEIVPQLEYQTDPARLVLPNALLLEGDPDLGFVPCVGRVLERAFKA